MMKLLDADLGDNLTLRKIIEEWACEFTGRPNDAIADITEKLSAHIGDAPSDRKELAGWMREPDYVENASLEWLLGWVNRRPLSAVAHVGEQCSTSIREAFRAGFWSWAGPANNAEFEKWTKDEQEGWDEWQRSLTDGATTAPPGDDHANLCEDCPPTDYPTDETRCAPCPRRSQTGGE